MMIRHQKQNNNFGIKAVVGNNFYNFVFSVEVTLGKVFNSERGAVFDVFNVVHILLSYNFFVELDWIRIVRPNLGRIVLEKETNECYCSREQHECLRKIRCV